MYKADPKETARYLGYHGNQPDPNVEMMIEQCLEEVEAASVPKSIHERFPLSFTEEGIIQVASLSLRSSSLQRNLAGCNEVFLFAATLGIGVDILIRRTSLINTAKAAVMQAAAATVIEAFCNNENEKLRQVTESQGFFLRPRYSPGYGDLSLECQRNFLFILKAQKNIGLTVTDSGLMVPMKSVTAIIGISSVSTNCHHQGCEECGRIECAFRR